MAELRRKNRTRTPAPGPDTTGTAGTTQAAATIGTTGKARAIGTDTLGPDTINATAGNAMHFRMGDFEIPFTSENFIQSFSLPNLYFHATYPV